MENSSTTAAQIKAKWEQIPLSVSPIYTTTAPNEDIVLHRGPAIIDLPRHQKLMGKCVVSYRWLPTPHTAFQFEDYDETLSHVAFGVQAAGNDLRINFRGLQTPSSCKLETAGDSCAGSIFSDWQVGLDRAASAIRFHLTNFPFVFGSPIRYSKTDKTLSSSLGRITLDSEEWLIVIDAVRNHKELEETTRRAGGHCISHAGSIRKKSGRAINWHEGSKIIDALRWFFALATGSWVGPILHCGTNARGRIIWRNFSAPNCDNLKTHVNWFTHEQADSLSALWPLFYAKWNDPYWNETLTRAIWFYVAGVRQSGGSDSALILAHAGLELLAWAKLIQTDHLISERGFDQLVAADKLRLLVAAMKLDLKIHSSQKQLEELARKEKWSAAPWALTEIRNALVHPKRRTSLNAHVINEAYTLAMHYFELGLLFVLGYRGKYTNRLIIKFHFDTEQVPWSSRVELKSQKGDITGHH